METYYWTMKNGQKINVDDMDENHLRNTLKLIIRRSNERALKAAQEKQRFRLNGDIAQNHVETMEDQDYFDECDDTFDYWKS